MVAQSIVLNSMTMDQLQNEEYIAATEKELSGTGLLPVLVHIKDFTAASFTSHSLQAILDLKSFVTATLGKRFAICGVSLLFAKTTRELRIASGVITIFEDLAVAIESDPEDW